MSNPLEALSRADRTLGRTDDGGDAFQRRELRELREEFVLRNRLERILVLQLRHQQLHEFVTSGGTRDCGFHTKSPSIQPFEVCLTHDVNFVCSLNISGVVAALFGNLSPAPHRPMRAALGRRHKIVCLLLIVRLLLATGCVE